MADFAAMTVVELKEECRTRGLTLGGVKKELIKRVKAYETKAARAKAKEQDKVSACKAPKTVQADPATSVTDAIAPVPAEVTIADAPAESNVVSESSLVAPAREEEMQQQLPEPPMQTEPAPSSPLPLATLPQEGTPAAPETVALETVALQVPHGATAPEADAVASEEMAAAGVSEPADMAPEAPGSEMRKEEATTVPQAAPASPASVSRSVSRSRSPLTQGYGYRGAKKSVSRSRSPIVRKEQVEPSAKFVLKKRASVLERAAAQRSPSSDESEASQDSSSSSSSRKSMRSRSRSQSVASPPTKSRRLMQSPAPRARNALFGAAIAALTPSRNGPASATPRKQMTPSRTATPIRTAVDPMSVDRARTRAEELRQRLLMSMSPAAQMSKAKTPGTDDLKARYQDFLTSAPTPTRAHAAASSGLTQQQDNLLNNFMNATPKSVAPSPVPGQQTAQQSPSGDIPQSPAQSPSVAPRNLTWALQDAVADEASIAKRGQVVDGKARMLEQLTKQLQVCLARLQDQRLDDENREKYQTLAASVKAQMDKVTDLTKPVKGMKIHPMGSPVASRGGC